MSNKTKYLVYNILDWGLSVGGSAGVILYNYITPDNSLGFKLTFSGIVLLVTFLFVCKGIFEKQYQKVTNGLLENLASETDPDVKMQIKNEIAKHETKNDIYNRLVILLPCIVLLIVCSLGADVMKDMQGTIGFIIIELGAGSVFNILKKPVKQSQNAEKMHKKANK